MGSPAPHQLSATEPVVTALTLGSGGREDDVRGGLPDVGLSPLKCDDANRLCRSVVEAWSS